MRRVMTADDLSGEEYHSLKTRRAYYDPLEDASVPDSEKQRLANLWEVINSNSQNHARLHELMGPLMDAKAPTSPSSTIKKQPLPLSSGLQIACLFGDINLVKLLVARGEDIDSVTMSPDNFGRGRCPISVATELGHCEIVKYLIGAGGDPSNIHDPPLQQAVKRRDLSTLRVLVSGGADPDPTLHQLLWPQCDESTVGMLLEAGATPSPTMLLTALWRGCSAGVIGRLLSAGCPTSCDMENQSALEVALVRQARPEVVDVLVSHSSSWTSKTHSLYPSAFRSRVHTLLLCRNKRFAELDIKVMHKLIAFLAVAEKREKDKADLLRHVKSTFSPDSLEARLGYMGVTAAHLPSMKARALLGLTRVPTDAIRQTIEAEAERQDRRKIKSSALRRSHSSQSSGRRSTSRGGRRSSSSEDDDLLALSQSHPHPHRSSSGSHHQAVLSASSSTPLQKRQKQMYVQRRIQNGQHPVADESNPNSPQPHHCTCCHVCHVSMKQRPRPTAACSQCNTIICKLCLQERWKNDQWEEACSTPDWVCHKCRQICVCKSCKAKGSRNQPAAKNHYH